MLFRELEFPLKEIREIISGSILDFSAFDTKKIDEYARQAKEQWGKTPAYRELQLIACFGELKAGDPASETAQVQVQRLQQYITEHFYSCPDDMLYRLGLMYAGGGELTASINRFSGEGTAEFAAEAIRIYCGK